MNRWFLAGLLAIAAGGLALRAPNLALRPMHNDEGVNALKVQALWEEGRYRYDPHEFHGPSLGYATLPFLWLSPATRFPEITETELRGVTVLFGLTLILLVGLLRDALGRAATLSAAACTALSPAMVFYSRYYIHEMLLVCFTLLALAAAWRYARTRHPAWAALAGAGLGLMHATKETFVLALAAMALAAAATLAWNRWREAAPLPHQPPIHASHAWLAIGSAVVVSGLLFTSFFTHIRGPLDSLLTYLPWTERAGGHTAHVQPWYFYFERLFWFHTPRGPWWSEGVLLLLGAVGLGTALRSRSLGAASVSWVRFLGFYTVFLAAIYAVIPYKTPWCALGFLHGIILLAGVGVAAIFRRVRAPRARLMAAVLLLAAASHLGWQAWRGSFGEDRRGRLLAADRANPCVYAQTLPDILEMVDTVRGVARVHPEGCGMLIKVISPEYLPLPWYLRNFTRVGWWDEPPADPRAPVMIVSDTVNLDPVGPGAPRYYVSLFSLREATHLQLHVEAELWERYVHATHPPGGREVPSP
ncbi:MAG: TIGR03663 family protein [Verrucomicrobia bacterium]|nr:TIGR03663 family protein [Verrucomicrobiota bacterium]